MQHEPESKNILDPNPEPFRGIERLAGRLQHRSDHRHDHRDLQLRRDDVQVPVERAVHESGRIEFGERATIAVATELYGGENDQYVLHQNYAVTQEFDLSSKPGGSLDWVVGAFYLDIRTTDGYDQYLRNPSEPGAPDISPARIEWKAWSRPKSRPARCTSRRQCAAGTPRYPASARRPTTSPTTCAPPPASATRRISNSTLLDNYFGDPDIGGGIVHLQQSSNKLTWKTGLDYQVTRDNLLYGSVSTGFKPGGGNPGTAPAVVPANYAPETITAFEVGSKNEMFDKRLVANLAGFYYIRQEHAVSRRGPDQLRRRSRQPAEGGHLRHRGRIHGAAAVPFPPRRQADRGAGQHRDAHLDDRQSRRQCRQHRLREPVRLRGFQRRRVRHPCAELPNCDRDAGGAARQGLPRRLWQCAAEPAGLHRRRGAVADLEVRGRLEPAVAATCQLPRQVRGHRVRQFVLLHDAELRDDEPVLRLHVREPRTGPDVRRARTSPTARR